MAESWVHSDVVHGFYDLNLCSTAGVWYVMWEHIGKVAENKKSMKFLPSSGLTEKLNNEVSQFADCHSAIKGVFLGM